jgi:myo-inositol-1(or 4)-monophosphatase
VRSDIDLECARRVAVEAAEAAGDLLNRQARKPVAARPKGTSGDVVTDLDLAAEQLILGRIREAYPGHGIVSEEAGVAGAADSPWTWLVDPLDGTNNIAIGLPIYTVGLALCSAQIPVLGVVHNPITGETWSAVRGRGTHGPLSANARRRAVPVLAWTQGHEVARTDPYARALRAALEVRAQRVLQLWAPLTAWVMLADGRIDGFVGYRPEIVDLPAGALIAREAGHVMVRLDGLPYNERIDATPWERSFVAGRPAMIDWLLDSVRAASARQQKGSHGGQECDGDQPRSGEYEPAQRHVDVAPSAPFEPQKRRQ